MEAATHEATIRQRAYAIWEEEGRPTGREWDHWAKAAQEILTLTPVAVEVPPAPKPRKTTKGRIRAALKSAMSA
jgi:hypothetical protein